MAKTVLVDAYRRFFSDKAAIEAAYQKVLEAHQSDATDGVVITSGSFEGGGATGQYVVRPRDREELMEVFEILLKEKEAEENNEVPTTGPTHTDFSRRIVET